MNAARLDKSARLQRVLAVLQDGAWHTTMDIIQTAHVCAVSTIAAELRHPVNGYDVQCRPAGKGRYEYRLKQREYLFAMGVTP